ncbi:MAG: TonB-dependent receptor [Taibaiella sp.]
MRDYEGKRNTLGFNTTLEYKLNENTKVYLKGIYGSMNDEEVNRKTMFNWSTGWGQSIKLQNIHDIMQTRFMGVELGGNVNLSAKLKADWVISSNSNQFHYGNLPFGNGDDRNGYHVVEFEKAVHFTDFLYLDKDGNVTDERNAFNRMKVLDIDSPIPGYGDNYKNIQPKYNNVFAINAEDTMFSFTRAYSETNRTFEKDPLVAGLDLNYSINSQLKLKFGGKYRKKTGERKVGLESWERNKTYGKPIIYDRYSPVTINERGGFLQELGTPYKGNMFPFLTEDGLDGFVNQMGDTLVHIPFGVRTPYFRQVVGSSYAYAEQVYAGYAMLTWTPNARLTVVPGFRAEYTLPEVTADSVLVVDPALGTVALTQVKSGKHYLSLLPMLNVKYALTHNDNLRAAVTRTFRRPNFNEIKPGAATMDYSNFDIVFGNPNLRPTYSWNFDLAYEQYLGAAGMFSVAAFYKNVQDHIYTAFESSDADTNGVANEFQIPGGVVAKKYQNAAFAYAMGIELSFFSKLKFLPGILKDVGAGLNYSYTHSRMKIEARETMQALPRQSPSVLNAYLSFENSKLTARVGLNYRDPYLFELNLFAIKDPNDNSKTMILHQDNDFDTYVGKSMTLDLSFSYKFHGNFSAFMEVNNLTNTPFRLYRGRIERPLKTEYYSIRGLAGIRYTFN